MNLQMAETSMTLRDKAWLEPAAEEWQSAIQQDLIVKRDMAGLEQKLCEYVGAPHCVSVESATTGMLLALKTADVGSGDTVLCTSFSYFATAEIIALTGARPLLVDINPNTYNIDPYCLEYVVGKCVRTKHPVPKALIAVDLFGLPCNYDSLAEICQRHGICLIEDMAQSFGASYRGKRTGGFGRLAVSSFFPSKPVDEMGEGGAVFCHSSQDVRRLESLRRKIRLEERQRVLYNTGSYLDAVQASVVVEKLENFDFELECRREVAEQYQERLAGAVKLQQVGDGYESAYTQFVISLPDAVAREAMMEHLRDRHIPCQMFDPSPLRRRGGYDDWGKVALVNAKSVSQRILALPIHPYLSRRVVDYICDQVLEGVKALEGLDGQSREPAAEA